MHGTEYEVSGTGRAKGIGYRQGKRYKVQVQGTVQITAYRAQGTADRVQRIKCRVQGIGDRQGTSYRVQGTGDRQGTSYWVQGIGYRQGTSYRVPIKAQGTA